MSVSAFFNVQLLGLGYIRFDDENWESWKIKERYFLINLKSVKMNRKKIISFLILIFFVIIVERMKNNKL